LYVHGENLIRARDVNLPTPTQYSYPIYDPTGNTFTNSYYTVDSFSTWQTQQSFSCPFPPCLNDVARPIPQLTAINQFDSAATSIYHGMTVSLRRRMTSGFYFRSGLHVCPRHRRRTGRARGGTSRNGAEHLFYEE